MGQPKGIEYEEVTGSIPDAKQPAATQASPDPTVAMAGSDQGQAVSAADSGKPAA